jgi:hypothetical protein
MKFNIQRCRDPKTFEDVIRFEGEVSAFDIMRLRLDALDQMLLNDSKNLTQADCLQILEMLFRRHEEK